MHGEFWYEDDALCWSSRDGAHGVMNVDLVPFAMLWAIEPECADDLKTWRNDHLRSASKGYPGREN